MKELKSRFRWHEARSESLCLVKFDSRSGPMRPSLLRHPRVLASFVLVFLLDDSLRGCILVPHVGIGDMAGA
jgi:hypothetical protein